MSQKKEEGRELRRNFTKFSGGHIYLQTPIPMVRSQ